VQPTFWGGRGFGIRARIAIAGASLLLMGAVATLTVGADAAAVPPPGKGPHATTTTTTSTTTTSTTTTTTTSTTTTIPTGPGPAPGGADAPPVTFTDGKAHDFPDPSVLRSSRGWYAYATGFGFWTAQVASSPDGRTWTLVGDPFSDGSSSWADLFGYTWAPDVIERPANPSSARFVMYYTSRDHASGTQCIGRATAANPTGPFVDTSTRPMICQTGGSIDPSPYIAPDGTLTLLWSSGTPSTGTLLWSQRLSSDGLSVKGPPSAILTPSAAWEAGVVEGPAMMTAPDGTILLFYSGNDWTTSRYAEGVARCATVSGPCQRIYTTAVLSARGAMESPGGGTPFVSSNGAWMFAFHAWQDPAVGYPGGQRSLRLLPISFTGSSPEIG
jgi:beta-xylosidase